MTIKKLIIFAFLSSILIMIGCQKKPATPKAELDTPEHHVNVGMKMLKNGKIDDAYSEFKRAKELDPEFSPAYLGLGLVAGHQGNFKKAFDLLDDAEDYADDNKNQEFQVHVGYMRLYILGRTKAHKIWLIKTEKRFEKAIELFPDRAEPYYRMGIAYKMEYKFTESAAQFRKVLNLDKKFTAEADREYAVIQRIERAMPGTKVGKKIALLPLINRADVAALFIEELRVDELFQYKTKKQFDTSFKSPGEGTEFKTGEFVAVAKANDIQNHVLKADIEAVLKYGIKGLQPYPDHTFRPDKTITRAEFALMVEDILIKITNDEQLATKFIGSDSPFPDLRSDLPYFNAAMVCITRNIMETKDVSTGEFDAMGTVSGADSLLSIRMLKNQIKKY